MPRPGLRCTAFSTRATSARSPKDSHQRASSGGLGDEAALERRVEARRRGPLRRDVIGSDRAGGERERNGHSASDDEDGPSHADTSSVITKTSRGLRHA
jgi:hypothetical protein